MPFFQWRGVDLTATIRRGVSFARSRQELDQQLLAQSIALLSSKPVRYRWRGGPIGLRHLAHCFRQFAVLTGTGVLAPEALAVIGSQACHPRLQDVIQTIAEEVSSGIPVSLAMARYPRLMSPIMVQLVAVGEESGSLPRALEAVSAHLERSDEFYSRLRSVLLLPAVTLLFFFGIAAVIFTVVIPYFADLFASMNHELPLITQLLIAASRFVRSWYMGCVGVGFASALGVLLLMSRRAKSRRLVDALLLRLPLVGGLLVDRFMAYLLHATALLLDGGVPLAQALGIVGQSVGNTVLRADVQQLEESVQFGNALSSAMQDVSARFGEDLVAMTCVGEESGTLALILHKSAAAYHDRLVQRLTRLMALLQPALMVVLGLLIATLVFAVYGPIVTMARIV